MGILQVKLFGRIQVSHDNWFTEVKITRVIQKLLAYLLLQRDRTHPRDVLAALFWGEQNQEKARARLNTTLWRLRRVLEPDGIPPGTYLLSNHTGEVGFNQESPFWLDIAVFEGQIDRILTTPHDSVETSEVEKLVAVLKLYEGELLESFYEDWALRERERLRSLYLNSLTYLLYYEEYRGFYEDGLGYGRQILELDPLREEIHREMIRLYLASGQRAMASRQYKTCCEILKNELGVRPMEETQALYTQILTSHEPTSAAKSYHESRALQETLNRLSQAAQTVEELRHQLYEAIGSIKGLNEDRHEDIH